MGAVFKAFPASNTDMKVNRRAKHIAQHDEDEYDVDDVDDGDDGDHSDHGGLGDHGDHGDHGDDSCFFSHT